MVHQSSPSTAFPGRAWSYLAPRELIPTPWNRACQSGQEKEAADPPQVGTTTSEWLDFCKGGWQGPGEAQRLARTAQRPGSVAFIRRMTEEKLVILTHPRLSLSFSLHRAVLEQSGQQWGLPVLEPFCCRKCWGFGEFAAAPGDIPGRERPRPLSTTRPCCSMRCTVLVAAGQLPLAVTQPTVGCYL